MECLAGIMMPVGRQKQPTKNVDLCGKVVKVGDGKEIGKNRKTLDVCELILADQTGSKITISVWNEARPFVQALEVGSGVSLVGVSAMKTNGGQFKLNMWDSAFVCKSGPQVQSLTDLSMDVESLDTLTAAFVPVPQQPDVSVVSEAEAASPTV